MTTPTPPSELARQLDRSFGDGPASASPVDRLTSGRRSLRRRRGAGALATAAAVAALATITFIGLAGGGPSTTSGIPVAAQGADQSPTEPPRVPADPAPAGHTVHDVWLDNGVLSTGSAVEILQRIDDPLHLGEPSYALDVRIKGKQLHLLLVGDDVVEEPAKAAVPGAGSPPPPGFEHWLAGVASSAGDRLALVQFGAGETLEPVAATRSLVEQTTEVDLPRRSAGPDDLVAAAAVDFAGERWFVLAHQAPDRPADFAVLPRDEVLVDLGEFIALVEDGYTSGALR